MYWLYILICLSVKYLLYGLTEKFHFSFIQTMELFAININLNKVTQFYLPTILSDIFVWIFYGIPTDQINYLSWVDNYKLIYSILGLLPLLFLFIIKDLIFYKLYKKELKLGIILSKFSLIYFLPFLTLAIRDICFLETNSFINSFIAIFVISSMIIGLPAFIFDILYGNSRLRTRKKYYFLLNNFTRNFKFMSLIHILQQIIDSIGIALYNNNSVIYNSYLFLWKSIFLILNLTIFKNSFEDLNHTIYSNILQIIIILLNYGFIFTESITSKIILNIIYFINMGIYLFLTFKRRKNKKKDEDLTDQLELTSKRRINDGIPNWAINEYVNSFKNDDISLIL